MGTVGLSFGSPTSGQGFDVATTVTQIQAASSAIENPWNTQLTALKAQDTVFSSLGTDLSTLTNSLQSLTDAEGIFAEMEGSSSNTDVLSLTSTGTGADCRESHDYRDPVGTDVIVWFDCDHECQRYARRECDYSGHDIYRG